MFIAEIDRVLKRVAEGCVEFQEILDKLSACSNASQREKIELEMKKEIKKLQRYRDQIKGWLLNSDIKEKTALWESRQLVEVVSACVASSCSGHGCRVLFLGRVEFEHATPRQRDLAPSHVE